METMDTIITLVPGVVIGIAVLGLLAVVGLAVLLAVGLLGGGLLAAVKGSKLLGSLRRGRGRAGLLARTSVPAAPALSPAHGPVVVVGQDGHPLPAGRSWVAPIPSSASVSAPPPAPPAASDPSFNLSGRSQSSADGATQAHRRARRDTHWDRKSPRNRRRASDYISGPYADLIRH